MAAKVFQKQQTERRQELEAADLSRWVFKVMSWSEVEVNSYGTGQELL